MPRATLSVLNVCAPPGLTRKHCCSHLPPPLRWTPSHRAQRGVKVCITYTRSHSHRAQRGVNFLLYTYIHAFTPRCARCEFVILYIYIHAFTPRAAFFFQAYIGFLKYTYNSPLWWTPSHRAQRGVKVVLNYTYTCEFVFIYMYAARCFRFTPRAAR